MQTKLIFMFLIFFFIVTCAALRTSERQEEVENVWDEKSEEEVQQEKAEKKSEVSSGPSNIAEQLGNEYQSNFVAEITFEEGMKHVSANAKEQLRQIYQEAAAQGVIEMVKVVTWADKEYPSEDKGKLVRDQQKIVEDRNDNIEAFLETMDDQINVDKFSMAERPGTLRRLFMTKEARIKKSLEAAGIPTTEDAQAAAGDKASKSIIMFILKDYQG
jgi:hypothetical protein